MIEQKLSNNPQLQKATSRRSRKDEEGRDFQCGCGKRYLSYPALYTHIKTKHDGRQPEGTQKTGTTIIAKRVKIKGEDESNKILSSHLQKSDLKLLEQLDQNHLGSVSPNSRLKKQSVPKEIYENYLSLTKQIDIIPNKKSNLDLVLALYLFNLGQFVNEKLYEHYLLFAKLLRNCYQEHGEEVFKTCFSKKEGSGLIQSFNCTEVQYVPIICDCLLRYYIPYCESTKEYKDINLSLMELMISDFCVWLFKKKLTNIKVSLKKEYRLEVKPTPLVKRRSAKIDPNKDKELRDQDSESEQDQKENENCSEEGSQIDEQEVNLQGQRNVDQNLSVEKMINSSQKFQNGQKKQNQKQPEGEAN